MKQASGLAFLGAVLMALGAGCGARAPAGSCKAGPIMECLTPPVCSYDEAARCEVCRCAAPAYVPPPQQDPTALPQPQR